jgi:replication factor A1
MNSRADDFTPIKSLNTMNPDWIIRGRVTKKGQVKTFNKQGGGGQGKLFSVDLIDAYGDQIQATFFSEAVDKFEPKL